MRILVTGGAGFVGAVSVEVLAAAGHSPVVLDDLSTGHRAAVPDGIPFHEGSCGDSRLVEELLGAHRVDAILHCAARSRVEESVADPARYWRDNVVGGIVLLDAARRAGVARFVLSSTAAVYGAPAALPVDEDAPLRPVNPYGETKRTLEAVLASWSGAYGFRTVSLRYFNAAGASATHGEDHRPETHLIPRALAAVERDEEVVLYGDDHPTPDGTCVRDYVHVLDLAEAHLAALVATDPVAGPPAALALNLGGGAGTSVREVFSAVERVTGRRLRVRVAPRRMGDPPGLVAAIDRARMHLGWRPHRSAIDHVIGSAWAWRHSRPRGYDRI